MGYNKLVLMCNDADHAVTENPAGWWEACKEAFFKLGRKHVDSKTYIRQPESFGHGNFCNAWEAVWESHANNIAVVIVGGNNATVVGVTFGGNTNHTNEDAQIKILKEILKQKGYAIRKLPVAKTQNKA